jgi:hypothetical protein
MNALPTITRTTLRNGQAHYTQDGAVHTNKSNRHYTHASVYRGEDGRFVTFLHSRLDLAVKGSKNANPAAYVGAVEIVDGDVTPAPAAPAYDGPSHDPARCSVAGCTLPAMGLGA